MLGAGYAYWVSLPPSQYETQFQEALHRQQRRLGNRSKGSNAYEDPTLGPVLQGQPARGDLRPGLNRDCLLINGPFQIDLLLASRSGALDLIHFASLPGSWLDNLGTLSANLRVRSAALAALPLSKLSPPELKALRDELARSQWKAEDYVQAYEGSILDFPANTPQLKGLFAWPGVTSREVRLFKNDFTAQLERVRSGESFQPLSGDTTPDWAWLCGHHGVLRSPFVKPVPDCHEEFERVRRQQAFIHLLTGILLERAETGQWPVSLEEMADFQPLAELDRKKVSYDALGESLEVSWLGWSFKPPVLRLQ